MLNLEGKNPYQYNWTSVLFPTAHKAGQSQAGPETLHPFTLRTEHRIASEAVHAPSQAWSKFKAKFCLDAKPFGQRTMLTYILVGTHQGLTTFQYGLSNTDSLKHV